MRARGRTGPGGGHGGLDKEGTFKAAEKRYTAADQVDPEDLRRWLAKARDIQWDYKNTVGRNGRLDRLK